MPINSEITPNAKLIYTDDPFAYAYTAAVLTNGLDLVRGVMLFEGQKDLVFYVSNSFASAYTYIFKNILNYGIK